MTEKIFLLDSMLGSLNRWLRICGYNTIYSSDTNDEELLKIAKEKNIALLTKDQNLYKKGQRAGVNTFLVSGEGKVEELASVARKFDLKLNSDMSKCTICGEDLRLISKEKIQGKIPSKSLKVYKMFWNCESCGKIFWQGSHWRQIVETISEASRLSEG